MVVHRTSRVRLNAHPGTAVETQEVDQLASFRSTKGNTRLMSYNHRSAQSVCKINWFSSTVK